MAVLRSYQSDIVENVKKSFLNKNKRPLVQLPTGGGKNVILNAIAEMSTQKGKQVLILAHRVELIEQIEKTARELFGLKTSFIAPKKRYERNCPLQIGSVQTVANRLDRIKKPDLIITDEAHHYKRGSQYDKVYQAFDTWSVGLTATPCRLSGEALGDYYDDIILGPSMKDLISEGYLCDYDLFIPPNTVSRGKDLDTVKISKGDFQQSMVEEMVNKPSITGDAINEYYNYCHGKRAVCFCVSIRHAKAVAEQFRSRGIPAMSIDGAMDSLERQRRVKLFRQGEILVLTNCNIVTEGFDLPAIEAVVQLRPTASLGLYLQMVGRGLRIFEGKEKAIILDHVNNFKRHGYPDEEREWSLKGRAKPSRKDHETESLKVCEKCFIQIRSISRICNNCGHEFTPTERRQLEHIEGELKKANRSEEEIRAEKRQARQEQGQAKSYEELLKIGKARGMKNPYGWAYKVLQGREAKKNRKSK